VLKKPLQHIPIPVKTAMSLEVTFSFGTRATALPTAPRAVSGKAMFSGFSKPKIIWTG